MVGRTCNWWCMPHISTETFVSTPGSMFLPSYLIQVLNLHGYRVSLFKCFIRLPNKIFSSRRENLILIFFHSLLKKYIFKYKGQKLAFQQTCWLRFSLPLPLCSVVLLRRFWFFYQMILIYQKYLILGKVSPASMIKKKT